MTALVIADKENVFSADDSGVIKVANLALYKQEYFVFFFFVLRCNITITSYFVFIVVWAFESAFFIRGDASMEVVAYGW